MFAEAAHWGQASQPWQRAWPLNSRDSQLQKECSSLQTDMLNSLSVRTKLLGTISLVVAALILVSTLGLLALSKTNNNVNALFEERTKSVAFVGDIYGKQLDIIQSLDYYLAVHSKEALADLNRVLGSHRESIQRSLDGWEKLISSDEGRRLHADITRTRAQLIPLTNEVKALVEAGDLEKAKDVRTAQVEGVVNELRKDIEDALAFQLSRAQLMRDESQAMYESNRAIVLGVVIVSIVLALIFAALLIRGIMSSLAQAVSLSNEIASGKLGHQIQITQRDEFGALLTSLQSMDGKLNEIVGGVRTAADSVGSAAGQLSQGNDDLSQRTQEQAAALEQTAASMEEMTATVKQNADNARSANQLANGARTQADRGGVVVSEAVQAMQEINNSSRKIADIISVIDEIAFQTNLLALNAAVEAARAGEQGRGFAVVATEVRSLAQRSASAAKEIKDLIGDSVEKVRTGSELVDSSGKVLAEIMDSVKKVSDIVAEISAASEEQSAGIDQVNNAVTQMDQTTQQNAALVEEAAAASKAMQQQAQQLVAQIGFFSGSSKVASQPSAVIQPASNVAALPRRAIAKTPKPVAQIRKALPPVQRASGGESSWQEF